MIEIVDIIDEIGNVDRCEVQGTRVIRVIERNVYAVPEGEDRTYQIGYAHACGYRD